MSVALEELDAVADSDVEELLVGLVVGDAVGLVVGLAVGAAAVTVISMLNVEGA